MTKKYLDYDGLVRYHNNLQLQTDSNNKVIAAALNDLEYSKAELNDVYSKAEIDNKIGQLGNISTNPDVAHSVKSYVDKKVADVIGAAPETLNTLEEIAEALNDNATMSQVVEAISTKANSSDVYTKTESDEKFQPVGNYALKSEVEDSELVTSAALNDLEQSKADKSDLLNIDYNDLKNIPDNISYISNDSGEGIIPIDGIRGEEIAAAAEININPEVVTFITGEIGSNTNITLTVPNDALWHVWDMFLTTAADGGATIVVPTGATLHVPSGYSIASGKTYEIRVIGKGLNYYLAYGEFA